MSIKKFSILCASMAAALSMSAQVSALGLPLPAGTLEVYLSGASAQSNMVRELMSNNGLKNDGVTNIGVCERGLGDGGATDTLDIYEGTPKGNWNAYTCTLRAAIAGPNINVIVQKRDAGGSATGVQPVAQGGGANFDVLTGIETKPVWNCASGTAGPDFCIAFMEISVANCPGAPVLRTVTPGSDVRRIHNCAEAATILKVSDGGWSDVEPKLFGHTSNVPGGGVAVTAEIVQQLNSTSQNQLIFNTPVTLSLRNRLQLVEFGAAHGCVTGALDPDSITCMPSLSRQVVQSLMVGTIINWDQVDVIDSTGKKVSLTNALPAVAPSIVRICRRVKGSGTQAQFNAIFLGDGCSDDAIPALTASAPVIGPSVLLNSGSSDVGRCLDDMDTGLNSSGLNGANFFNSTPAPAGSWAIGVQSTEKNANEAKAYRFIKIDGAAPTAQEVHAGNYFDWAEQTFQTRGTKIMTTYNATHDPAQGNVGNASIKTIIDKLFLQFRNNAASPEILRGINSAKATHNLNSPSGDSWVSGYLALPKNGVSDTVLNNFNPVNNTTRAPLGLPPSNCRVRCQID